MSLVIPEKFQHILRVLNTNIDGRRKIAFAITAIKGVGRRYAHVVLRKADIDLSKRAGELTEDEVERVVTIMQNPRQYKIPDWFLNRQKDIKDGKYSQVLANGLDNKLREDLERLKKIRAHRGLRHFWGLRVRGQHTKTTGRRGRTVDCPLLQVGTELFPEPCPSVTVAAAAEALPWHSLHKGCGVGTGAGVTNEGEEVKGHSQLASTRGDEDRNGGRIRPAASLSKLEFKVNPYRNTDLQCACTLRRR
ncbi:hypothetical protein KOW79_012650 [Hemibagrus wyckioides]|uniref:Small ribosomal subunit protein uS13 n=2 Tax=Neopterygii TaxID=41665 RepID=A0A9D3SMF2_9TELE|nr:hypothetical protein KOW79_012650 [Hemibagrus wyckioides]